MYRKRVPSPVRLALLAALLGAGCEAAPTAPAVTAPDLLASSNLLPGSGRPAVLVNPNVRGNGTARTIQQGIAMVAPGGKVMILPGTYEEALVIDKGLTLESVGGASGSVIVAPPTGTVTAVQVATNQPVTVRGLTVQVPGAFGIRGAGTVNLTVEGSTVVAVDPPLGGSFLVFASNDERATGGRARLVVRQSTIDATVTDQPFPPPPFPQSFGILAHGDVDALLEGNAVRRTGGACIFIVTRDDLGGELNADLLHNDLDECHPIGRVAAIIVGPFGGNNPSPERPLTATGVVNIIGNTIRNSSESCLTSSAIVYEVYTGRIERNRIVGVVQECAAPTPRNLPSAVWIGARRPDGSGPFWPPVTPTVRFNDIAGNAYAGLRIASNQTVQLDATCNYWGAADGPSGIGPGSGDAILVEPGGALPLFEPFAGAPIAASGAAGC